MEAERYRPIVDTLLETFGPRLKAVVLFGSQARGESRPESDHDLLVVIEGLPRDPVRRARMVRSALLTVIDALPGPLGLVARTPEEVAADVTPLMLDICTEGICLYGAAYFEPYRQQVLEALRRSRLQRRRLGSAWMWVAPLSLVGQWELQWERSGEGS